MSPNNETVLLNHSSYLLDQNAVQWKMNCLVFKGKRKGELRVSSSAQAGRLATESTRGSYVGNEIKITSDLKGNIV